MVADKHRKIYLVDMLKNKEVRLCKCFCITNGRPCQRPAIWDGMCIPHIHIAWKLKEGKISDRTKRKYKMQIPPV